MIIMINCYRATIYICFSRCACICFPLIVEADAFVDVLPENDPDDELLLLLVDVFPENVPLELDLLDDELDLLNDTLLLLELDDGLLELNDDDDRETELELTEDLAEEPPLNPPACAVIVDGINSPNARMNDRNAFNFIIKMLSLVHVLVYTLFSFQLLRLELLLRLG